MCFFFFFNFTKQHECLGMWKKEVKEKSGRFSSFHGAAFPCLVEAVINTHNIFQPISGSFLQLLLKMTRHNLICFHRYTNHKLWFSRSQSGHCSQLPHILCPHCATALQQCCLLGCSCSSQTFLSQSFLPVWQKIHHTTPPLLLKLVFFTVKWEERWVDAPPALHTWSNEMK